MFLITGVPNKRVFLISGRFFKSKLSTRIHNAIDLKIDRGSTKTRANGILIKLYRIFTMKCNHRAAVLM